MDGPQSQQEGDRSRPTNPRPASRSSNGSANTRATALSSKGSYTKLSGSPQQGSAHSTHRSHHSNYALLSSERPRSQLSRESVEEPKPAVSSFLQEQLQSQRRAASVKSNSRHSNETMSASADFKTAQNSPLKRLGSTDRRPQSSGSGERVVMRGQGVRESEKVGPGPISHTGCTNANRALS